MNKVNIIPIGSGSSGNAMFIELGPYKMLIDVGINCKRIDEALTINSYNLEDIDIVFITHVHNDHIKGFNVTRKRLSCPIYGSDYTKYYLYGKGVDTFGLNSKTELLQDLYVTMFEVSHDQKGTVGYIFEYKDTKIGYVTDIGIMPKSTIELLRGSNIVIIESNHDKDMLKNGPYPSYLKSRINGKLGHLSNEECAKTILKLYDSGTRNFLLAHISKENNTHELAYKESYDLLKKDDVFIKVLKDKDDELLAFLI